MRVFVRELFFQGVRVLFTGGQSRVKAQELSENGGVKVWGASGGRSFFFTKSGS
jgi:hypothetical protein